MSLSNLPISRKLALAFGLVLVAIAAMGAVIFLNLNALNAAGAVRSVVNQDIRDLDVVELRLARQENSFRGYLVSGDPYYIERLDAHRAAFLAALADLRQDGDPATAQSADAIEAAGEAWHQSVVVDGVRMAADPATRQAVIDMVGPDGAADTYMAAVEEPVEALKEASMARLAEARAVQSASARNALIALFAGLGAALAIAVAAGWILTRGIAGPALNMVGYMRRLMGGDTSFEVPCVARKDEFGEMGRAVVSFRDAAVDKIRVEQEAADQRQAADGERAKNQAMTEAQAREQAAVVTALGEGLDRLSQGDLTYTITTDFPGDYAKLKADFNLAMQQLRDAMTVVVQNVGGIRSGAGEISQAADDLSRRTEQQAASLEETAAALDEITATVNRTASGARQASDTVKAAKGDAESSGLVVREAVQAMGAIEKSAQEINQIIGVIDEIAFQTNLLALNAGVEAARAGEAGRGFAVVASEVRALAQRSAEAAKEIKVLISASTTEVNSGVSLVGQTGDALERIVGRVGEIDALVSEIAASAQEQATGLQQVNTAVNQMDQVTQQNAAMVEQSTAASHSLSQEAEALAASISRFKTGVQAAVSAARAAQPAPAPISAPRPTPAPIPALKTIGSGGAALKIDQAPAEDGWEEF